MFGVVVNIDDFDSEQHLQTNSERSIQLNQMIIDKRFEIRGGLSMRKLIEYFPTMVVTNLSILLLTTIDGLVAGNLIGKDALSSINFFYPVSITISIVSSLVSCGAATCLSTCMGRQDHDEIRHLKSAVNITTAASALIMAVGQIPLAYLMIASYHLDPEMSRMTWQYAIGVMIATPFGLISTVGVYQMQIMGKMKYLLYLSVMEGLVNTGLDLLFVGPLDMGVAGAGYGSAGANVIRCAVTVVILWRTTDIYKTGGKRPRKGDVKEILSCGLPDGANTLMLAVQNYCIMQILLFAFGSDGGVIRGVCTFCFSLANVIVLALQGSMRPLTGLMSGAKDTRGLQILMRQGMVLMTILMAVLTIVYFAFADWFYHLHGVKEVPDGGTLSLQLYSLFLVFRGMNTLFRLYFANRKDKRFATWLTILGNATLPVFAYVLYKLCPAPWIWSAFLCTETLILILNLWRYRWWGKKDAKEADPDARILHLSVRPEEVVEASRMIRAYAESEGIPLRIASRIAFCIEEIIGNAAMAREYNAFRRRLRQHLRNRLPKHQRRIAYLRLRREEFRRSLKKDYVSMIRESIDKLQLDFDPARDIKQFHKDFQSQLNDEVETQIIVRMAPEEGCFVLIDDGRAMALEESLDLQEMVADDLEFVKKISKSVEYQYILNMNYTTVKF